jgi:pimeloyl-ACP methyl ester carboxylesterase
VAELHPERIRELVYVAGILPKGGQTMAEILAGDPASLIAQNQVLSGDRQSVSIREEALKDIFYGDCSEADVARAKRLLVPQALAPVLAQIHTTERRFGWVPRVYVTTLQDRAIIPDLQARMYTALPCRKVVMLNTSHSPFFSAPTDLAGQLHGLQQDA